LSITTLWKSYQQSGNSSQEELAKEMMNSSLRSIFVHTSQAIFTLQHGASGLTSPLKKVVLRIFIARKNPLPLPGLNPRTFGPVVYFALLLGLPLGQTKSL
jgi:hypothetical protein